MDTLDILTKIWPLFLAFVFLVIILAKANNRFFALEEKVKVLFDLWNKKEK